MDEETREQVIALLTRIGMVAEDLSAIALGAPELSSEELNGLVAEIQRRVLLMKVFGEQAAAIAPIGHP